MLNNLLLVLILIIVDKLLTVINPITNFILVFNFFKYLTMFDKCLAMFDKYLTMFSKYCTMFDKYHTVFDKYCTMFDRKNVWLTLSPSFSFCRPESRSLLTTPGAFFSCSFSDCTRSTTFLRSATVFSSCRVLLPLSPIWQHSHGQSQITASLIVTTGLGYCNVSC